MCGIAGVISWSEQHRTSRATLSRMSAAIAHRGPDGEGIYFDRDPDDLSLPITPDRPQVAFAFRRLAVLDPTPCSDQPFVSTDGRYVLVFNGEIYNFRELREKLTKLHSDYVWRSTGDTEVVMQSYAEWGERCVEKFNGMFALAVWDHRERSLFLSRDRMGQKPLYVAYLDASGKATEHWRREMGLAALPPAVVMFASEVGALPGLPAVDHHRDTSMLTSYLQFGCLGSYDSFKAGMHQVPPAGHAIVTHAKIEDQHYWPDPATPVGGRYAVLNDEDAVRETRDRVRCAVTRQLVSDVPLGCFLSGGVDSSIVAVCARRSGPLQTFSIAFDDARYDESAFAREVAAHVGSDHHEFRVTPDVITDLPKLAEVFGDPFGDSSAIPTHYLARETRKHVTVALSGDGGDELFGGYDRYLAMSLAREARRSVTPLPWKLLAMFTRRLPGSHPKSRIARIKRFIESVGLPSVARYQSLMRLFSGDEIVELLEPVHATATSNGPTHHDRIVWAWGTPHHRFSGQPGDRLKNEVVAALAVDRLTYLPDDLLTKVDRCSMLHGLEVRSPFMDHELVELAAQLTEDQLLKGGKKRMLREAFAKDLPDFVFKRPKMGFAVPIGEWFRRPLRAFLRDHLFAADSFARAHFKMPVVERLVDEHDTERRDHSQRLYALLMLELWWTLQRDPATLAT
jgi:asparagine synthase (glutamine-hydrolysing)